MSKIWKNGETAFSRAIHEIDLKKKARDDKDRKHALDAQLGRIKTLGKFDESPPVCPRCGDDCLKSSNGIWYCLQCVTDLACEEAKIEEAKNVNKTPG